MRARRTVCSRSPSASYEDSVAQPTSLKPAGPHASLPSAAARARFAVCSPSFIGTSTPSSDTATVTASFGTFSSARSAASNFTRSFSHRADTSFGSRSRLLLDGFMPPSSPNRSSPSCGVRCATTHVACFAANGVQKPPITPARSSIAHAARSPSRRVHIEARQFLGHDLGLGSGEQGVQLALELLQVLYRILGATSRLEERPQPLARARSGTGHRWRNLRSWHRGIPPGRVFRRPRLTSGGSAPPTSSRRSQHSVTDAGADRRIPEEFHANVGSTPKALGTICQR